jgi:hypothetical protein
MYTREDKVLGRWVGLVIYGHFTTNLHSSTSFPISDILTTKEITKLSPISQSTFNVFLAHREIFVSQIV